MTSPNVDPIDSLLDFSEYDALSPALSPMAGKTPVLKQEQPLNNTPTTMPTSQTMPGPSHQYDLYRQQTGFVPGAITSTLSFGGGYNTGLDYLTGLSPENDLFDFNTAPTQPSLEMTDMDIDFNSPTGDASFLFTDTTINPSSVSTDSQTQSLPSPPTLLSTPPVVRAWPGMHSQAAAMAKAQAQQRQQQQIIQQQRQSAAARSQQSKSGAQVTDPIVEQKITQLLHAMRAKSSSGSPGESQNSGPTTNLPRLKKDEDDMDEDERLLASEEGKKLSSKERRQLRNKVSARAFRSRRKEYITQLEAEIAIKVNENGDLRVHNQALVEENKRLSDLTRMLLSSPSFSNFLDQLSSNPSMLPQAPQQPTEQSRQQQNERQAPKDVNPYLSQTATRNQTIGMAIIPEQSIDFSSLTLDFAAPQVYTAEVDYPVFDASKLSGKESNFVGPLESFESDNEKVELPVIQRRPVEEKVMAPEMPVEDDDEEDDSIFSSRRATKSDESVKELDTEGLSHVEIFGGVESEKVLARYELLDATEEEKRETLAMARFRRMAASLESVTTRLEKMTIDL